MPTPYLKKLAKEAGISVAKAEKEWDKAKNIVKEEYNLSPKSNKYWALVMSITKKKVK